MNAVEWCADVGTGAVIVDGKGDTELAERVVQYAQQCGRKVYFFNAVDVSRSNCVYAPFSYGSFSSQADKVTGLRLWSPESEHYKKLCEGFGQMTFRVLEECGMPADLMTVAEFLDTRKLLGLVRSCQKKIQNPQQLANLISAQRAAENHVAGVRTEIQNLSNSALAPLFDIKNNNQKRLILDLYRARAEDAIVYFALPALVYLERASALGRLITNDLKVVAASMRRPWVLEFDEFGTFSGPQILNIVNMGRSYGIRAMIATQTLADIARGVPEAGDSFVDQLLGSINTFIVHRLNAPRDAEMIAELAGTEQHVSHTAQTIGGHSTGVTSARITREFRVHPDQLKQLAVGDAIYINKNSGKTARIHTRRSHITRTK